MELIDLGKILTAAADAITKVVDAVAKIVKLSDQAVSTTSRRSARKRLVDIAIRLRTVHLENEKSLLAMTDYIAFWRDPEAISSNLLETTIDDQWMYVELRFRDLSKAIIAITSNLNSTREDIVLEPFYRTLERVVMVPAGLLNQIGRENIPKSSPEIEKFRTSMEALKALQLVLTFNIDELNEYVKKLDAKCG